MIPTSPQPNIGPVGPSAGLSLRFWGLACVTGAGAGLAGGLLMLLLRVVQHVAWSYRSGAFVDAVQTSTAARRVAVLVAAGVLVAAVRWLLRQHTGGHGGDLSAAIWFRAGRLAPLRALTNAVTSIVIVGLGASLGREAAPKQAGAVIASVLAGWAGLPPGQRRLLAACGAGAGMAAVYDVPFGGALFALEVLLGTVSLPLVAPALATSVIATGVSWLLLPDRPTYEIAASRLTEGQIAWALLAGPLAGLASIAYIRAIAWADARKPEGPLLVVAPVLVFGGLGCLAIPFPQLLGNGHDVAQQAFAGEVALPLLALLGVLKPLVTCGCLGSGAPGGLFTPTLTYGALLGGLLGQLWGMVWPGVPPGSTALIGAAAVLAASMQGPVSAVVLMIELTRHIDALMVPMLLCVCGAVIVTRRFEARSIYSARIHSGRAAAALADGEGRGAGRAFAVISAAAHYGELLQLLLHGARHTRPVYVPVYVLDETGEIVGEIRRDEALSPADAWEPLETATAADFARPLPAPAQR